MPRARQSIVAAPRLPAQVAVTRGISARYDSEVRIVAVWLSLAGCQLGFPFESEVPDASGNRDGSVDALPACRDTGFTDPPLLVSGLPGGDILTDPTLHGDELWFGRNPDVRRLRLAYRMPDGRYSNEQEPSFADPNPGVDESHPSLTADGQRLLFRSVRDGVARIYETRREAQGPFDLATVIAGLPANIDGDVTADGLGFYFTDGAILFVATRPDLSSPFGSASKLLDDAGTEIAGYSPAISADEREVFYAVFDGMNPQMIFRRTRTGTAEAFGPASAVVLGDDPDVSADGRTIVYDDGFALAMLRRACE